MQKKIEAQNIAHQEQIDKLVAPTEELKKELEKQKIANKDLDKTLRHMTVERQALIQKNTELLNAE